MSRISSWFESMGQKKPLEKSIAQQTNVPTLRWYDLTAYGIAATVGSGIYVTCGRVARDDAGPAVILSILIAGILSLMTGLCYLEFASALPISGSGYAYFYTLMGEFLGWFIGWNLTLEYAFAAAVIAGGWVEYLVSMLGEAGVIVPKWLYSIGVDKEAAASTAGLRFLSLFRLNLLAGVLVLLVGLAVSRGMRFGAFVTNLITLLNLAIIAFIVIVGATLVQPSNWQPFFPLGADRLFGGAGTMFFSFIGYDTVSTLAADAISPGRDVPIAVILTVMVATGLYMAVGLVLTGMLPYSQLDAQSPLAMAFTAKGAGWASYVVAVCAMTTMGATMFACLLGQPKIFAAIANDGLLPAAMARENRRGVAPWSVAGATALTLLLATFFDTSDTLVDMISFGTLFGMSSLCAGLLITRLRQHEPACRWGYPATAALLAGSIATTLTARLATSWRTAALVAGPCLGLPLLGLCALFLRYPSQLKSSSPAFSCPAMPLLPAASIIANSYVMLQIKSVDSIWAFLVWTALGLVIYFAYGLRHSHLRVERKGEAMKLMLQNNPSQASSLDK